MLNRLMRIGISAVIAAAAAIALLGGPARAELKTQALGNGNFNAEFKWQLPCGNPEQSLTYNQVPPGLPGIQVTRGVPPDPRVIMSAIRVGGVIYSAAYALGGACAGQGGSQTTALPDTLSTSVGLYPPGGGLPDTTRMMRFAVIRTPGNVRLVCLGGGLQTGPVGAGQVANSVLKVAVHPNQASANADVNNTGVGALFFGKVTLAGNTGALTTQGGFVNADWTVQNDGNGKFTALPVAGLTKDVPIGGGPGTMSEADAVVSVIADPQTDIPPAPPGPGHSPVGLLVLTLSLMAVGFWVIRSRRNVTFA